MSVFAESKHVVYLKQVSRDTESFEYEVSQHFRMSGIYWCLTAMAVMGRDLATEMDVGPVIDWLFRCQDPDGNVIDHSSTLHYTYHSL
jgi:geranylgeranyl transferase type-2 subunit beta